MKSPTRALVLLAATTGLLACEDDPGFFIPFGDITADTGDTSDSSGDIDLDSTDTIDDTLPECFHSTECEAGEICEDGVCVLETCEPGATRCSGNASELCDEDGAWVRTDCTEGTLCQVVEEVAGCVEFECAGAAAFCLDGFTTVTCDGINPTPTLAPCGDATYCAEGTCVAQLCVPDSVSCDGLFRLQCDALGSQFFSEDCSFSAACAGADSCACVDGECVGEAAPVCTAGTTYCEANATLAVCNEDGSAYEFFDCPGEAVCLEGSCQIVENPCDGPGNQCAGNTLLTCDDTGAFIGEQDCALFDQVCGDTVFGVNCTTRCPAFESTCLSDTSSQSCGADGRPTITECADGFLCTNGFCQEQICTPFERFCEGASVLECDFTGTSSVFAEACDFGEECIDGQCIDNTFCGNGVVDDGEECDDGNFFNDDSCSTDCQALCDARDLGSVLGSSVATGSTTSSVNNFSGSCGGADAKEVSFTWQAPTAGTYRFTTAGTAFDTVLYVRTGECEGVELDCNDDVVSGTVTSQLDLTVRAFEFVYIFVDGYDAGDSGSYVLNISRL